MITAQRVAQLDWQALEQQLNGEGFATVSALVPATTCATLADMYDDASIRFRRTIDMARYRFGSGEYKYFSYPLPEEVQALRETLYPPLAAMANRWSRRLGENISWPRRLAAFTRQCHGANQLRPTPLLLRYGENDYNCLHQDLYGAVYFPFQVIVLLNAPGRDFTGGELVLVEQRPRMQSRPLVVPLQQGDAVVIPVRELPRQGARGVYRAQMRHGVSRVLHGSRTTLGIIFHDAA